MAQITRTWWGKKFIEAIEQLTDAGRLSRGRSYANGSRVKNFEIEGPLVTATVKGKVNPYFGVYTEPLYSIIINFQPISPDQWSAIIALISTKASLLSQLLLNQMPDTLEESVAPLGVHLLPTSEDDFRTCCSCPDYSNPCKHIAGVYYLIAAQLDQDPFLLFELRGLSREQLQTELAKSPLGQALATELSATPISSQPVATYYPQPQPIAAPTLSLKQFWQADKRLPQGVKAITPAPVTAILIKKQGDLPPFWHRDNSFIEVMTDLYERAKKKI